MLELDNKINLAWQIKELFTTFKRSTNRSEAETLLNNWIATAKESGLEKFKAVINTLDNWKTYI